MSSFRSVSYIDEMCDLSPLDGLSENLNACGIIEFTRQASLKTSFNS